jgi:hypothetical protein
VGGLAVGNPFGCGREEHPVAGVGGFDSELDRETGFPGRRRAEEDDVLRFGQEHPGAQMGDGVTVEPGLVTAARYSSWD